MVLILSFDYSLLQDHCFLLCVSYLLWFSSTSLLFFLLFPHLPILLPPTLHKSFPLVFALCRPTSCSWLTHNPSIWIILSPLELLFYTKDGGSRFLWNVANIALDSLATPAFVSSCPLLAYSSTPKMDAAGSSEMLHIYQSVTSQKIVILVREQVIVLK
jgi:hypothetical protein